MPPDPTTSVPGVGARRAPRWQERLLFGAMLALALFSFEAGLANIALARDEACRSAVASARVAPAEGAECFSELELAATNALASGPAGVFAQGEMNVAAWVMSGMLFAALGGACAQLKPGRAVLVYLGVHASLLVVVTFLLYVGPHVVA